MALDSQRLYGYMDDEYDKCFEFQFPSNGKAEPKLIAQQKLRKRSSFNSLQTGKRIQSLADYATQKLIDDEFQFPSNGKADTKVRPDGPYTRKLAVAFEFQFPSNGKADTKKPQASKEPMSDEVSIPFKRESVSKVGQFKRHPHPMTESRLLRLCVSVEVYPKSGKMSNSYFSKALRSPYVLPSEIRAAP